MQMRAVAVVAVVVVGSACGSIAERAAEEVVERAVEAEGGGDVDVDFNDGEFDVEGDDFSMDQEVGQLPADWPSEVVMPAEFVVQNGIALEDDNGQGFAAQGEWNGTCDPDFLAFVGSLPSPWQPVQQGATTSCGGFATAMFSNGTWVVTYSLIGDDTDGYIAQVQVFEDSSGSTGSGG